MELKTDTSKLNTTIDPMIIDANIKLDDCSDINDYVNKFNNSQREQKGLSLSALFHY